MSKKFKFKFDFGLKAGRDGNDGLDGATGSDGQASFKSFVFTRSITQPNTPIGGTFSTPVPSGWSDGIPSGVNQIWISSRIFTSDGNHPQQESWSQPREFSDTADIDVEVSPVKENPGTPATHPQNWYDANESVGGEWWMAMRVMHNGIWGSWTVFKIQGEDGASGNTPESRYAMNGSFTTPPSIDRDARFPSGWTLEAPTTQVGQYIWVTNAMIDADNELVGRWNIPVRMTGEAGSSGQKGETGDQGLPGYGIYLSNESHTFPATATGAIAGSATTTVRVLKGQTYQTVNIGTITGQVAGLTTSIGSNNTTAPVITITVTTSLTTQSGVLNIPITADGQSFTRMFSWSLSKNGGVISLQATSNVFKISKTGAITPATITVTGTAVNTTISSWQYSTNGGSFTNTAPTGVSRSGNVVTLTGSTVTANTIAIKMADSAGNSDTTTISRVMDGVDGADGLDGADGADGAAGVDARAVNIILSQPAITYNSEGTSPSPSSITVNANAVNTSGTVYYQFFVNDTSVQNTTSSSYSYTSPANISGTPVKIECQIREGSSSGSILARDQTTIVGIRPGSDAITISLSNEAHVLPTTAAGVVTYAGSGTDIKVWIGSTQVPVSTTLASSPSFNATATGTSVTPGAASTVSTYTRRFANHSAMTADRASVSYNIQVKDKNGVTHTFEKVQSLAKSKEGQQGVPGQDGLNQATVFLYRRTETSATPTKPSTAITYTFANGNTTAANNGWTRSLPSSGGRFKWMIWASAISANATVSIPASAWSDPVIHSEDGIPGTNGPALAYRGNWSSIVTYKGTPNLVDFVVTGPAGSRQGYIARTDISGDGSIPAGTAVTNTTYWNGPIPNADALFTDFFVAYSAYIDNLTVGIIQTSTEEERTTIGYTPTEPSDPTRAFSRHAPRGYYPSGRIGWTISYIPSSEAITIGTNTISDAFALVFYKDETGSPIHGAFSSNLNNVVFAQGQTSYHGLPATPTSINTGSLSLSQIRTWVSGNSLWRFHGSQFAYKNIWMVNNSKTTIYRKAQQGQPDYYVTGSTSGSPNISDGWYLTSLYLHAGYGSEVVVNKMEFTRFVGGQIVTSMTASISVYSSGVFDDGYFEYVIAAENDYQTSRPFSGDVSLLTAVYTSSTPSNSYLIWGNYMT